MVSKRGIHFTFLVRVPCIPVIDCDDALTWTEDVAATTTVRTGEVRPSGRVQGEVVGECGSGVEVQREDEAG